MSLINITLSDEEKIIDSYGEYIERMWCSHEYLYNRKTEIRENLLLKGENKETRVLGSYIIQRGKIFGYEVEWGYVEIKELSLKFRDEWVIFLNDGDTFAGYARRYKLDNFYTENENGGLLEGEKYCLRVIAKTEYIPDFYSSEISTDISKEIFNMKARMENVMDIRENAPNIVTPLPSSNAPKLGKLFWKRNY